LAKKEERKQTVKTMRTLPCALTDTEKIRYGRQLADYENDSEQIELDRKAAADGFKERLSAVDGSIRRLAVVIRDGIERRDVECEWIYHWESFTKQLIRCDTNEVIESEVIGHDERQLGLDSTDSN
jgi:hypothetical protein